MSNVYRVMVELTDLQEPSTPIDIDPVDIQDLRDRVMSLQQTFITWNNTVKERFDAAKASLFPDFKPGSTRPALICSVVQDDSFSQIVQKISDFIQQVIVPIENSLVSNVY